ncbi:D-alanyl-D-alanine carboxypeptidase [Mesorhizobium xinjiangense]|uniref:D-alanyl-D-alanine carboxypeptidase n=1 Tax=Mesorhizobium xinjiangense TaxID=2678685 RepID=UPI001F42B435|nr:D-alanyl-D-alanine carboxypeptidase [Mesorhizobium xinjiangense]
MSFKVRQAVARSFIAFLCAVAMLAAVPAQAAKYAGFVIDANTGETLYSDQADEYRYPASLTKMMTLYMIFEALQAGRIKKDTRITFSPHAAAQPPTKLGVRAGGSITVETAIYSLVTKSANDAAAAVAEHLGGTESGFARMMTRKAHSLGMKHTTFRNASGLPNSAQKTTARDMATLGLALREHFPQYYSYFSTRSYTFGKRRMGNHNKLLGRVKGVDGIKTGYIRAAGFNLVASVKRDGRSIVAVVMGGKTGRSRDAHMADLIQRTLPKASRRDSGPLVAKRVISPSNAVAVAAANLPRRDIPTPATRPQIADDAAASIQTAYAPQPDARPALQAIAAGTEDAQGSVDPVQTASTDMKGWVVQVASTPTKQDALSVLERTSETAGPILANASPFTVVFEKDGTTFHRARYSGFETKTAAWDACSALKKKKIACYAVEQ